MTQNFQLRFMICILIFRSDYITFGRNINNLHGNDTSGIIGHFNIYNNVGSNLPPQYIENYPEDVDKCATHPGDFQYFLNQFQVLNPALTSTPQEASINLQLLAKILPSRMNCLLKFSDDYKEVAKIKWALSNFFTALELRLITCVF